MEFLVWLVYRFFFFARRTLVSLRSNTDPTTRATSDTAAMAGMTTSSGVGRSKAIVLPSAQAFAGTETLNAGLYSAVYTLSNGPSGDRVP